jgi:hypothetical protein
MPYRRPTLARPQGNFPNLVTKILNLPCEKLTPDQLLGWSGVGRPQGIELEDITRSKDTLFRTLFLQSEKFLISGVVGASLFGYFKPFVILSL